MSILEILWNPTRDIFQFRVTVPSSPAKTKRAILSTIAKFFDPLGWASPVSITAKIFMQRLWSLQCRWDDDILSQLFSCWFNYHQRLSQRNQHSALDYLRISYFTLRPSWVFRRLDCGFRCGSIPLYRQYRRLYQRLTSRRQIKNGPS